MKRGDSAIWKVYTKTHTHDLPVYIVSYLRDDNWEVVIKNGTFEESLEDAKYKAPRFSLTPI